MRVLAALLALGCLALIASSWNRAASRRLRLVAPNRWVLCSLCSATGAILRSGPLPTSVEIDLTAIAKSDDMAIALLKRACRLWQGAGVPVSIEVGNDVLATTLRRHEVQAQVLLADDQTVNARSTGVSPLDLR